jgi:hypothetical protein
LFDETDLSENISIIDGTDLSEILLFDETDLSENISIIDETDLS